MTPELIVQIDELRSAMNRVLDKVQVKHGSEVTLAGDHYWSLPTGDAFDVYSAPGQLTIGQLADDVQSLREAAVRPVDDPVAIWHELAHVIGVLRGIEKLDRRSNG